MQRAVGRPAELQLPACAASRGVLRDCLALFKEAASLFLARVGGDHSGREGGSLPKRPDPAQRPAAKEGMRGTSARSADLPGGIADAQARRPGCGLLRPGECREAVSSFLLLKVVGGVGPLLDCLLLGLFLGGGSLYGSFVSSYHRASRDGVSPSLGFIQFLGASTPVSAPVWSLV